MKKRAQNRSLGGLVFDSLGAGVVAGLIGLAFGLIGEIPWEQAHVDALAYGIVGALFYAWTAFRVRQQPVKDAGP